jgi:hypothetical protein
MLHTEVRHLITRVLACACLLAATMLLAECREPHADALRWALPDQPPNCEPARDTAHASAAMLRPGRYELTLIATGGSDSGHRTRGRLWLTASSAADQSPRTGERVPKSDTVEGPLYGATDVPLSSVGAPMMDDTIAPKPQSTDPIYPGVRVLIQNWQFDRPKRPVILIGTLSNLRNGRHFSDGGGIGLFVTTNRGSTFSGDWGPWGIMANGSGYFCATALP